MVIKYLNMEFDIFLFIFFFILIYFIILLIAKKLGWKKKKVFEKYKIKLKSLIGQRFHLQKLGKWELIQTS